MQKEETRRIILAAAYSLFGKKGYEKTTMRELAYQADVGLGTIFKHFPDKPSLLVSTYGEDLDAVLYNSFETIPASNIKMQLTHIIAELYDFFGQNVSFSRSLLKEAIFLEGSCAELLTQRTALFRQKTEGLVADAIARGELKQGIAMQKLFSAFLSFFLLGLVAGLRESEFNAQKQTFFFASLLENHLSGVQKP